MGEVYREKEIAKLESDLKRYQREFSDVDFKLYYLGKGKTINRKRPSPNMSQRLSECYKEIRNIMKRLKELNSG